MNILIVLLTVCFVCLLGYLFIKTFNFLPGKEDLSVLGHSYGLGIGLISLQLYLFSRLNISWDRYSLIFPWIVFFALVYIFKKPKFNLTFKFEKLNKISLFLMILILISTAYVLLEALIRPLAVWDGWAIWLLKSKIFFIDGKIIPSVLNYVKSDYPLVVSLFGTFIYIVLGHVDDTAVLLAFFAFYLFLGIIFFSYIKERFGMTYALLMTFIFLTLQNLIRHGGRYEVGQADLALGYYIFLSETLLLDYIKKQEIKKLILLNIFLGITGVIKFEGLPFVLAAQGVIAYFIFKERKYKKFISGLLWILPVAEWGLYKRINNVSVNYFYVHQFIFSLSKIPSSIKDVFKELVNIKSWSLLWFSYFFLIFCFGVKKTELTVLNIFILLQFFAYMMLYFFTVGNSPESSIERLLVHIAPLAMLYVAIAIKEVYKKNENIISYSILSRLLGRKV